MVYLSVIKLNVRTNAALRALADTHAMHRLLLHAFPEADAGGPGRVLFRAELGGAEPRVLVQSTAEPEWSRAGDAIRVVSEPKRVSLLDTDGMPVLRKGQALRFRLRANPTFRAGHGHRPEDLGKRLAIMDEPGQLAWLERKGGAAGFEPMPLSASAAQVGPATEGGQRSIAVQVTPLSFSTGHRTGGSPEAGRLRHFGVEFDGILRVTDPARLVAAIESGIGPAKGFGFGLLSVAPVRE